MLTGRFTVDGDGDRDVRSRTIPAADVSGGGGGEGCASGRGNRRFLCVLRRVRTPSVEHGSCARYGILSGPLCGRRFVPMTVQADSREDMNNRCDVYAIFAFLRA